MTEKTRNKPGPKPGPKRTNAVSILFSDEEYAELDRLRGVTPRATYLRGLVAPKPLPKPDTYFANYVAEQTAKRLR